MPPTSGEIGSIAAEIAPRITSLQVVHPALVASVAVFLSVMLARESAATDDRSDFAACHGAASARRPPARSDRRGPQPDPPHPSPHVNRHVVHFSIWSERSAALSICSCVSGFLESRFR